MFGPFGRVVNFVEGMEAALDEVVAQTKRVADFMRDDLTESLLDDLFAFFRDTFLRFLDGLFLVRFSGLIGVGLILGDFLLVGGLARRLELFNELLYFRKAFRRVVRNRFGVIGDVERVLSLLFERGSGFLELLASRFVRLVGLRNLFVDFREFLRSLLG